MFLLLVLLIQFSVSAVGRGDEWLSSYASSARAFALGKAFTAMGEEAGSNYWNPANYSFIKRRDLRAFSWDLFLGTEYRYYGYVQPVGRRDRIGFSWLNLSTTGIEGIDQIGNRWQYSEMRQAMIFTLAHQFSRHLGAGINFKLINYQFNGMKPAGYGLDAGILYFPFPVFQAGISFQNAVSPVLAFVSEHKFPKNIKFGGRFSLLSDKLLLLGDYTLIDLFPEGGAILGPKESGSVFQTGLEFRYGKLSLRLGHDQEFLSTGWGLRLGRFTLDYAHSDGALESKDYLGLGIDLGLPAYFTDEEERKERAAEHWKKARRELRNEDYELADEHMNQILYLDPQNRKARDFKHLIVQIRAEREKNGKMMLLLEQANAALEAQDFQTADRNLDDILKLYPDHRKAKMLKIGIAGSLRQQTEKVSLLWQKAQEENLRESWDSAEKYLDQILVFDPSHKESLELKKKIKTLRQEKIKNVLNQFQEGKRLYEKGDFRGAFRIFEDILSFRKSPDVELYRSLSAARLALAGGEYVRFRQELDSALKVDPSNKEAQELYSLFLEIQDIVQ